MTEKTTSREPPSQASNTKRPAEGGCGHANLDYRYGEIGILAVAAAVRYAGGGKSPACAPALDAEFEERFVEVAA